MKDELESKVEEIKKDADVQRALEAIVRYLVHPKEAGRVKTRLIADLLTRLNAAPDRVLFPRGNTR